ncbi:MAG: zinc ribbon domain-containing protein [Deltaproteobacteria bacterium]|nr:zinc ribbon domain-containing protein [Deltaproteobacteria bacterium]
MPLYEYACSTCNARFEMLQPVGAPPPDACPVCGAPDVHRLVSVTSFVLKGSGWYRDGYGLQPAASPSEPSSAPSSPPASAGTKAAAK